MIRDYVLLCGGGDTCKRRYIGHATTMRELRRLPRPLHVFERSVGLIHILLYHVDSRLKVQAVYVLKGDYCNHFGSLPPANYYIKLHLLFLLLLLLLLLVCFASTTITTIVVTHSPLTIQLL